jgi:hypothetical protein
MRGLSIELVWTVEGDGRDLTGDSCGEPGLGRDVELCRCFGRAQSYFLFDLVRVAPPRPRRVVPDSDNTR